MTSPRFAGKVKWFSALKGFGFLVFESEGAPTSEDVFVHHTSIHSEANYRTVTENEAVEFSIIRDEATGKYKAVHVTRAGGAPIVPPTRRQRTNKMPTSIATSPLYTTIAQLPTQPNGPPSSSLAPASFAGKKKEKKKAKAGGTVFESMPPFHYVLSASLKLVILTHNQIDLNAKRIIDVAVGTARIKLGQGQYAGLADAAGVVAEGTYLCNSIAEISFVWERALAYKANETSTGWEPTSITQLPTKIGLTDANVGPVPLEETTEQLWGAGIPVPSEGVFEINGFEMRRVVLTRPPTASASPTSQN